MDQTLKWDRLAEIDRCTSILRFHFTYEYSKLLIKISYKISCPCKIFKKTTTSKFKKLNNTC